MKKILGFLGLACVATLLVACGSAPVSYTISGEYMAIETPAPEEPEAVAESTDGEDADEESADAEAAEGENMEVAEGEAEDAADEEPADEAVVETTLIVSSTDSTEPVEDFVDLSTATVVVSYEVENSDGESEVVELHNGVFTDGKVTFSDTINEPIEVTISVDFGEEDPLELTALVGTGNEVSFALVDYDQSTNPFGSDQLVLVGSAHMSRDEEKRFSISGDLSNVDEDLSNAVVSVYRRGFDDEGERKTIYYANSVMLVDGKFTVEADEEIPSIAYLTFRAGTYYSGSSAVVEPGAEITITSPDSSGDSLKAMAAGSGAHAKLIESWATSDEYVALEAQYAQGRKDYIAQMEADRAAAAAAAEEGSEESVADAESEEVAEETDSTEDAEEEETEILALKDGIAQADGCEHVVLDDVRPGIMDGASAAYEPPSYFEYADQMREVMNDALLAIVNDEQEDPINVLLAVELGAFRGDDQELTQSNELRVYDELASVMDQELVASRITPARDDLKRRIAVREADSGLVPGQKAPEFALPDLDGTEIALVDVVTDNQLVLIDFWASWCGPCIASFPHLKKLYSAYNEDGFEIVAISIDDTQEEWVDGSDENELPWINLGEIEGWSGQVASSYGVQFIPKGYLVDMKGCIVQKDLVHTELKEVLVAKFGEKPEEEAEVESETEVVDPGADDVGG